MTKIPRIHIEGALLYVTSRGDNDREIFKDQDDYAGYLELLRKYKEQYGFKLFAYCFLPNHLHLLLELKEGLTVSDIMHDLNANYTKSFNGRHARKGHLFQERYKMIIMEKDTYILKAMAYIHLNPTALGLAGNLEEYPYSSYLNYCAAPPASRRLQIDMPEEIKEISSRLSELSVAGYAGYLAGVPKEEMEDLGRILTKNTILGHKEFIERIERVAQELSAANKPEAGEPGQGVMRGKFIRVSVAVIAVLGVFSLYLYINSSGLKLRFKQELEQKNAELDKRLKEEKVKVVRDLKEMYSADIVSYEAMTKRVELEKKKAAELEEEIRILKQTEKRAK